MHRDTVTVQTKGKQKGKRKLLRERERERERGVEEVKKRKIFIALASSTDLTGDSDI